MFYSSRIEIDKNALINNVSFLRSEIGPNVTLSSVVKGNAYGHGLGTFLPMAEAVGINHFSVFGALEAFLVNKVKKPENTVMIMGHIDNDELGWAIENDVEFYVFELDRFDRAIETAVKIGKTAKIHIELETGMNRTGFAINELGCVLERLRQYSENIAVKGICTHYAGAESIANYVRVKKQLNLFRKIAKWFDKLGIRPQYYHTACSAAAMTYPKTRMDLVRVGILQYGFWPSKETFIHYVSQKPEKEDPLERLITWKSSVMSTKEIDSGEFIGYGTNFQSQNKMKVAIVPVGYSQGFGRNLSYQGRVLIRGQFCDVIGIVNMNLITVNVTRLESVEKGDEVVMVGKQGDNEISVASFGEFSNMLNYELLTRLPDHIPRIAVNDGG